MGGFVVTLGLSGAATSVEFTHGGFVLVYSYLLLLALILIYSCLFALSFNFICFYLLLLNSLLLLLISLALIYS